MSVTIELVDHASLKLKAIPDEVRKRLRVVLVRISQELADQIRSNISGPILNVRTGKLLASIRTELYETPSGIWARVYTTEVYAAMLEWGGQTRPHVIYPVNAAALHFFASGGAEVFAMKVNHPGSKIPAFAYMRTSLQQITDRAMGEMVDAVAA